LELEPVAITDVDGGCARAATFGEGKVDAVEIRRRSAVAVTAWRYFPSLGCAPIRDRI
jgi:hypothetical protein